MAKRMQGDSLIFFFYTTILGLYNFFYPLIFFRFSQLYLLVCLKPPITNVIGLIISHMVLILFSFKGSHQSKIFFSISRLLNKHSLVDFDLACHFPISTTNSGPNQTRMAIFQLTIYVLVTIISMHGSRVLLGITDMMLSLT